VKLISAQAWHLRLGGARLLQRKELEQPVVSLQQSFSVSKLPLDSQVEV
jgi:hypothetical protein